MPLVVFGEEGEQEYGGSRREKDRWKKPIDKSYLFKFYYSGENPENYGKFWSLPKDVDFNKLFVTQWSRFENWLPSKHADFAVGHSMRTEGVRSIGTFSTTSQLSDKLQDLHAYMMFIKFGFGRCTSDVGIAIREGWMDRTEGLELVRAYDSEFPDKHLLDYLKYLNMSAKEFLAVIDNFANKEVLRKDGARWRLIKPAE